jgi:hypothetical protein
MFWLPLILNPASAPEQEYNKLHNDIKYVTPSDP